jgi:hypothetical protein
MKAQKAMNKPKIKEANKPDVNLLKMIDTSIGFAAEIIVWSAYHLWIKHSEIRKGLAVTIICILLPWQLLFWVGALPSPFAVAKKALCWPVRAAVYCCVPASVVSLDATAAKIFKIEGFMSGEPSDKSARSLVTGKEAIEPKYTVEPTLEFDGDAKCGYRYSLTSNPNNQTFTIIIRPTKTEYRINIDYKKANTWHDLVVTKETYDKINIGDIVVYNDRVEKGAYKDRDKDEIIASFGTYTADDAEYLQQQAFLSRISKEWLAFENKNDIKGCNEYKRLFE